MTPDRIERFVWPTVIALLVIACILILRPFVTAILWAAILTYSTWPIFERLRRWVGQRSTLAATLMTTAVILLIVIPITVGAIGLGESAGPWIDEAKQLIQSGFPPPPDWVVSIPFVGDNLNTRWLAIVNDRGELARVLQPMLQPLRTWGVGAAKAVGEGVFVLSIATLIGFFLYKDGDAIGARSRQLVTRLAGSSALQLVSVAQGTIRGVVYGILGTAIAQAVLQTIGLAIAGVPGAFLLGAITFFLSVIPVGPPLVWGGAAVWLYYAQGSIGWAIFIVVWGVVVVSGVDNVIKPLLISRGAKLPFVLVLLGVLGGVIAFGFVGVFIGPTILAVAYRLVDEWSSMRQSSSAVEEESGQSVQVAALERAPESGTRAADDVAI